MMKSGQRYRQQVHCIQRHNGSFQLEFSLLPGYNNALPWYCGRIFAGLAGDPDDRPVVRLFHAYHIEGLILGPQVGPRLADGMPGGRAQQQAHHPRAVRRDGPPQVRNAGPVQLAVLAQRERQGAGSYEQAGTKAAHLIREKKVIKHDRKKV